MKQRKRTKRRIISILLALAMVVSTFTGIIPRSSITSYAQTYTQFTGGQVLHVGDTITLSNTVYLGDAQGYPNDPISDTTLTLLRANIIKDNLTGGVTITEATDGKQYVFKKGENGYYYNFSGYVTETSDGVEVTSVGEDKFVLSVHVPSTQETSYVDAKGVAQTPVGATVLKNSTTGWSDGWYVVPSDGLTIESCIVVSGTVNLILCNNATLTAKAGIKVSDGNTLNIYAQSQDENQMGKLIANGANKSAGIGGDSGGASGGASGTITINGGVITATGGMEGAGIGGGGQYTAGTPGSSGGTITINGGTVTATGGPYGAGIGGGYCGGGGNVTINGGTVGATGGSQGSGIGSGGQININTPAEGGTIEINGGTVTATGDSGGAGIGGGLDGSGGTITINGGTVTATGSSGSVGIGGGRKDKHVITNGSLTLGTGMYLWGGEDENSTKNIKKVDNDYDRSLYMVVNHKSPHDHSFTYKLSDDGTTITATCGNKDGCPLSGNEYKATLSISKPEKDDGVIVPKVSPEDAFDTLPYVYYSKTKSSETWTNYSTTPFTEKGFYNAKITIGEAPNTVTASVTYGMNCITYTNSDSNSRGSIHAADGKDTAGAVVGAKIEPKITADTGCEIDTLTVNSEDNIPVTVAEDNKSFTMPESNVTVSATFKMTDYTVNVIDADHGTVKVDKDTAHYGDKITLTVTPEAGYGINSITVKDDANTDVIMNDNDFTMPASNITVTASFSKLVTYTIFYKASGNPSDVRCRFSDSGEVYKLTQRAKLGSISCWSMPTLDAKGKTVFPASFSEDGGTTWSDLKDRIVKTDLPDNISGGEAVVIEGDTNAFIAAFVWDDSLITDGIQDNYSFDDGKASYYLVSSNVDSIEVPNPSKEGYVFKGWRVLDNSSSRIIDLQQNYTTVEINGKVSKTTIFSAVFERETYTVQYIDQYTGEAVFDKQNVSYGDKAVKPANPTKAGFNFIRWVVGQKTTAKVGGKEVTLAIESPFDFDNTEIVANVVLMPEWSHVHSYACLKLDDPTLKNKVSEDDITKYSGKLHVRMCAACGAYKLEAHSYDSSGKCACGYEKPKPTAKLQTYIDGKLERTTTATVDSEVSVDAPERVGTRQFVKWQYSSDGNNWYDLTTDAYASFILPASLKVKAVYEEITEPKVSINAYPLGGNLVFYYKYTLPKDWTVEDAYIISGNNYDLRYMKVNVIGPNDVRFAYETANALETLGVETLQNKMVSGEAVNINGYSNPEITRPAVIGNSGHVSATYSKNAINRDNGSIYYYGMGYLLCKDAKGETKLVLTDPICANQNNPINTYSN